VVLLHELHGRAQQWEDLVPYLHAAGFATLAYESRGTPVEKDRLPDALGALRWLRARDDVDPRRLALVGASIGASTTVLAMSTRARRTVGAAVALSPPDSPDIDAVQTAGRYRPHDVLFVSDDSESPAVDTMLHGAVRSQAIRSQNPGHGVNLLEEPGIRTALIRWLTRRVA
jgi:dienelactone hydrolase